MSHVTTALIKHYVTTACTILRMSTNRLSWEERGRARTGMSFRFSRSGKFLLQASGRISIPALKKQCLPMSTQCVIHHRAISSALTARWGHDIKQNWALQVLEGSNNLMQKRDIHPLLKLESSRESSAFCEDNVWFNNTGWLMSGTSFSCLKRMQRIL